MSSAEHEFIELGKLRLPPPDLRWREPRVADEEENPSGYYRDWSGPLRCVRINRQRFEELVYSSGLFAEYSKYRHSNDGQPGYVLSRSDRPTFQAKIASSPPADAGQQS